MPLWRDAGAQDLFTFLLRPGMGPTNSLAERSLRPSVIAGNTMHSLKTEDGMSEFGILMTCVMTWRARGQNTCQMFRNLLSGTVGAHAVA